LETVFFLVFALGFALLFGFAFAFAAGEAFAATGAFDCVLASPAPNEGPLVRKAIMTKRYLIFMTRDPVVCVPHSTLSGMNS
jgi:hypothetical protein